jgi:hypothetical protein
MLGADTRPAEVVENAAPGAGAAGAATRLGLSLSPADAELIELGRFHARATSFLVRDLVDGKLARNTFEEAEQVRKQVDQVLANGYGGYSESAVKIFKAFLSTANTAVYAANALTQTVQELTDTDVSFVAEPMVFEGRNMQPRSDVAPTLTAEGAGSRLFVVVPDVGSAKRLKGGRKPRTV